MRLRAVSNKHFAFIREARKEMREVRWLDWSSAIAVARNNITSSSQTKVKYDG